MVRRMEKEKREKRDMQRIIIADKFFWLDFYNKIGYTIPMTKPDNTGKRFELASKRLFKEIFPQLGFEVIGEPESQRGGGQFGFDLRLEARPSSADVTVRFFIECKGAAKIGPLALEEFAGKPEQLFLSRFCPDYWILFSPLRYLTNEFKESLQRYRREYPFALVDWSRVETEKDAAGIYLDLFKHFPEIYAVFKEDVPVDTRDTPPQYPLADILDKLQMSLRDAYGEYHETAVSRGILPGVRRITPYTVYAEKSSKHDWLALKKAYFQLDSYFSTAFPLVCRDEVVRSPEIEERICREIENPAHVNSSIAVLGSEGCGKTTLMYRLAVDYALKAYPVLVMDTLAVDISLPHANYEIFFKKIHALHNAGEEPGRAKPILVFIDNPHAAMVYLHGFLTHFGKYEETFRFIFIIFERESRYQDADDASLPLKVLDRDTRVIIYNKDSAYKRFRAKTREVFAEIMDLDEFRYNLLKETSQKHENIAIAEVLLDFYKRYPAENQRQFDFDWQDLEKYLDRKKLESFRHAYMWTAMVYKFGFPLPVSLLKRLLGLKVSGEQDYLEFAEMIERSSAFENFPLILEVGKLRTRHESIASLFVKEKKHDKIAPWLWMILERIDPEEEDEKSIFSGLILHKKIVREYLAGVKQKRVGAFARRFEEDHPYYRNVMMMKAWLDIDGRRLDQAKETLAAVVEKFPGFLPAYTELGKIYFEQKEYDGAKQVFENILQRDRRDLHARTELSKIYQRQKRYEKAEKVLLGCLKIDENDLNSRTELSKIYQRQKRYDKAEKVLLDCLKINENDLNSRTELSKIYQYQKKWDKAIKYLKEYIALDPNGLHPRTELSKIYQRQKRYDEAEKVLLDCLRINENDLNSRTELSKIYQYQKKWDEAIKYLKEYIALDPNGLHPRTELSKIYQRQKRYDEAERVLVEILQLDKDNLQARTELSKIYQRQKRYDEAERVLVEILQIDKANLQSRTELSKIYQRQKRYQEAENILKELLAIEPDNIHGCTEFALLYKQWAADEKRRELPAWREKKQLYYKYIKESYRINPLNLPTLMELCSIFTSRRQYRAALRFLEKAISVQDNDLETLRHLVLIYHTLNHETEVARLMEKGRRLMQEQPFIKYKDRFQALDLPLGTNKKLLQMNNTGTFSGQVRTKASNTAPPVIIYGANRYALLEKYTAHHHITDGDKVFFAAYQVGEKVYADFIEPYFQDVSDLSFFKDRTDK